jgi:hypothetical protein
MLSKPDLPSHTHRLGAPSSEGVSVSGTRTGSDRDSSFLGWEHVHEGTRTRRAVTSRIPVARCRHDRRRPRHVSRGRPGGGKSSTSASGAALDSAPGAAPRAGGLAGVGVWSASECSRLCRGAGLGEQRVRAAARGRRPARNAHCVEASRGHYMCSYLVSRPRRASECHLVQAEWARDRWSSFTVVMSGRVRRCGSLREAIHSLS